MLACDICSSGSLLPQRNLGHQLLVDGAEHASECGYISRRARGFNPFYDGVDVFRMQLFIVVEALRDMEMRFAAIRFRASLLDIALFDQVLYLVGGVGNGDSR